MVGFRFEDVCLSYGGGFGNVGFSGEKLAGKNFGKKPLPKIIPRCQPASVAVFKKPQFQKSQGRFHPPVWMVRKINLVKIMGFQLPFSSTGCSFAGCLVAINSNKRWSMGCNVIIARCRPWKRWVIFHDQYEINPEVQKWNQADTLHWILAV